MSVLAGVSARVRVCVEGWILSASTGRARLRSSGPCQRAGIAPKNWPRFFYAGFFAAGLFPKTWPGPPIGYSLSGKSSWGECRGLRLAVVENLKACAGRCALRSRHAEHDARHGQWPHARGRTTGAASIPHPGPPRAPSRPPRSTPAGPWRRRARPPARRAHRQTRLFQAGKDALSTGPGVRGGRESPPAPDYGGRFRPLSPPGGAFRWNRHRSHLSRCPLRPPRTAQEPRSAPGLASGTAPSIVPPGAVAGPFHAPRVHEPFALCIDMSPRPDSHWVCGTINTGDVSHL